MSLRWLATVGLFGFTSTPTVADPGATSRKRPSRLGSIVALRLLTPVTLPPGRLRLSNGIDAECRDDWNGLARSGGRASRNVAAECDDQRHRSAGKPFRNCGQSLVMRECPAIFDRHGLAFDIAVLAQAAAERGYQIRALIGRSRAEEPDHRHSRLLRARGERARDRRAADQRNELPPVPDQDPAVLPSAETAAMFFWALLASGQINMRKVDGWHTLATRTIVQPIDLAA
jgi:hypothetical protein